MSDGVALALDDVAETNGEEPVGHRCASTPETQARWKFLRAKRTGIVATRGSTIATVGGSRANSQTGPKGCDGLGSNALTRFGY